MSLAESIYHNKYPVINKDYAGRPLPGTTDQRYFMDIRHFIWADDFVLKELAEVISKNGTLDIDEIALNAQRYVVEALTYVGDDALGCSEYWMFPQETMNLARGDCEDGAILMASALLNALPASEHWRVRVACGWVKSGPTAPLGGHAYCVYCRETDDEWVILDWCYAEDSQFPVPNKIKARDKSMYRDVWFSFNHKYSWSHDQVTMEGRVRSAQIGDLL